MVVVVVVDVVVDVVVVVVVVVVIVVVKGVSSFDEQMTKAFKCLGLHLSTPKGKRFDLFIGYQTKMSPSLQLPESTLTYFLNKKIK